MKTIIYFVMMALTVSLVACSTTVKFPVSQIVPAADGKVMIKKDKNNNYQIGVKIKYLANADRLNPPKEHYIAWIITNSGKTVNIGMLASDKKNNASLQGLTSFKPDQIFITAENENNASWPSSQEIFRIENLNLK